MLKILMRLTLTSARVSTLFKKMAMILIAITIPVYLSLSHFISIFVNIFFKGCRSSWIAIISFRLFYLNELLNWIDNGRKWLCAASYTNDSLLTKLHGKKKFSRSRSILVTFIKVTCVYWYLYQHMWYLNERV